VNSSSASSSPITAFVEDGAFSRQACGALAGIGSVSDRWRRNRPPSCQVNSIDAVPTPSTFGRTVHRPISTSSRASAGCLPPIRIPSTAVSPPRGGAQFRP
jgi:hypothetical protein